MGDMAISFAECKEYWREKHQSNREKSTALLIENGIKFESRNDGVHLMI